MNRFIDKIEIVLASASADKPYKRWIANDGGLLFILSKETCSYSVHKFVASSGVISEWNVGLNNPLKARIMRVSFENSMGQTTEREEVYLPPNAVLSPDEKSILWNDEADYFVFEQPKHLAIPNLVKCRDSPCTNSFDP